MLILRNRHLPPEIHLAEDKDRNTKAFTQPADVWCFGMVMLEVSVFWMHHILYIYLYTQLLQTLSEKPPFFHMNELQASTTVAYKHGKPDQARYPAFPHDNACWQIMRKCWHWESLQREKMCNLLQDLNKLTWHLQTSFPFVPFTIPSSHICLSTTTIFSFVKFHAMNRKYYIF